MPYTNSFELLKEHSLEQIFEIYSVFESHQILQHFRFVSIKELSSGILLTLKFKKPIEKIRRKKLIYRVGKNPFLKVNILFEFATKYWALYRRYPPFSYGRNYFERLESICFAELESLIYILYELKQNPYINETILQQKLTLLNPETDFPKEFYFRLRNLREYFIERDYYQIKNNSRKLHQILDELRKAPQKFLTHSSIVVRTFAKKLIN